MANGYGLLKKFCMDVWHKIAASPAEIAFGANGLAEVAVGGRTVCLARFGNSLFAIAPTCPHAGGRFAEGFVDATGNVVCPLHRYKFRLQNGYNSSGEGYCLQHWAVKIAAGVYVNFSPLRAV